MFNFIFSILNLLRISALGVFLLLFAVISKRKSIFFFLKLSGPTFVKLGQLIASRKDLIGAKLSKLLSSFQDNFPKFSSKKAVNIIEEEFGKKIDKLFLSFSNEASASASIAQVHQAVTMDNKRVAVKILRPKIQKLINRDIGSLELFSIIVGIFSPYHKKKITEIIFLLKNCSSKELDLNLEADNLIKIRRNLRHMNGIYIPEIYKHLVSKNVLTTEWIDGIPFTDKEAITNSAFCKVELAKNLIIAYFYQIYENGFFHADMHQGNLILMKNGKISLVDFGIVCEIDYKTRIAVAEIVIGYLNRDYLKVAKIHIDSGLVDPSTDVNSLISDCKIMGKMIVGLPVKDISFSKLIGHLLKIAKKYNMKTNNQLLLLQKSMFLIEAVSMDLNPNINIWNIINPWIKDWSIRNVGFDAKIRDYMIDLFSFLQKLPDMSSKINKKDSVLLNKLLVQQEKRRLHTIYLIFFTLILIIFYK